MNNKTRYDRSTNFLELEVNVARTIGILRDDSRWECWQSFFINSCPSNISMQLFCIRLAGIRQDFRRHFSFQAPEALLISNQCSSFVGSVYCRNLIIKLLKIVKVSIELAAFKVNKNRFSDDEHSALGHFRIMLSLFFKASPSAQLFVWKWVLSAWIKKRIFVWKATPRLTLKKRHKTTQKWSRIRPRIGFKNLERSPPHVHILLFFITIPKR